MSYIIYSEIFDAMRYGPHARLQRLSDVLSGTERERKFAHLSAAARKAIVKILRDTKAAFPF